MSQPSSKNHNPNNKITKTVVGLRQIIAGNHPPQQTKNHMIEQKESNTLKKFISLYEETPKQFLNPAPTPNIANESPKKSKLTPKLSQNQKLELKKT